MAITEMADQVFYFHQSSYDSNFVSVLPPFKQQLS